LAQDLRAIVEFPAAALITLMEMGELDWAGPSLAELGTACAELGLRHLYLPIVDCGVPDQHWELRWQSHGPALHALLHAGENIVFHCRGGRGRAGLAVTRMLIEIGEDPAAAIARVRGARSGAIETEGQEEYLLRLGMSF
jgi:protein-tyrosine phosphatase